MSFWESVSLALEGVSGNKFRSMLTMLGIIIGIASVIAVVAIGQGGQRLLENEVERVLGTDVFRIYVNYRDGEVRNSSDFTLNDVNVMKRLVPELKSLAASNEMYTQVKNSRKKAQVMVTGSNADFIEIRRLKLLKGRFFTEADVTSRRKVLLIDEKLAKELFAQGNPVGQKISIGLSQLVVIGVVEGKQSFLEGDGSKAYTPITVWQDAFQIKDIYYLEGQGINKESVQQAMEQSVKILERRHRNGGHYQGSTLEQEMEMVNKMTSILTVIISAIAGISLFVGGIGVMNIMLVSVTERTREIGIRKALGAKRKDILIQFLIESVVICSIGGIVGMALGIGGSLLVSFFAKIPPLVSWSTVIIALLFSCAVGIFFGLYPANKASKLDPIDALRFE